MPEPCVQAVQTAGLTFGQGAGFMHMAGSPATWAWKTTGIIRRLYNYSTQLFPQPKVFYAPVTSSFYTQCTSLISPITKYINIYKGVV